MCRASGAAGKAPVGVPQVDGSQRWRVTDLLACVPHPVACSPRHFTGRTGGGTELRRPLTGTARLPGTSALTLALGFASRYWLVAGCPRSPWGQQGPDAERHCLVRNSWGPQTAVGHFPVHTGNLGALELAQRLGSLQVISSHSACAPRALPSCTTCCCSLEPLLSCSPVPHRVPASGAASNVLLSPSSPWTPQGLCLSCLPFSLH